MSHGRPTNQTPAEISLTPDEGWHCSHLYYEFDRGVLSSMHETKRLDGRDELSLPSVYHVWRGADFQEREIWDLMGISFSGHPNMKRIMLWEGFEGHPLRKDYL